MRLSERVWLTNPLGGLYRKEGVQLENLFNMDKKLCMIGLSLKVSCTSCKDCWNPYPNEEGVSELVRVGECISGDVQAYPSHVGFRSK